MAITITEIHRSVFGNKRIVTADLDMDSSYPTAGESLYCASKFGVNGITQSLSKELGPKGIRVNSVCPVLIPTKGLIEALKGPFSPANDDPEGFIKQFTLENKATSANIALVTGTKLYKPSFKIIKSIKTIQVLIQSQKIKFFF